MGKLLYAKLVPQAQLKSQQVGIAMTENTARRTHAPSRRAIEAEESAGGSIPGRPRSHTPEGSFFRSAVERRAVVIGRNGGEEPLQTQARVMTQ